MQWMYMVRGMALAEAALVFVFLLTERNKAYQAKGILGARRKLGYLLRGQEKERDWYRRTNNLLRKDGADYHLGKRIEPIKYMALRICLALVGVASWPLWNEAALVLGVILYGLLPWYLHQQNKRDNEKMLPDLKLVYHSLELQIRAGVYITDALAECYSLVQDRRLKDALLDLAGDIVMKAELYESLERFRSRFDNKYVDSLCITILQAMESGQAVEVLGDISEQMKDMEAALYQKKKASMDRSITFIQLGVMTVILGIALYACLTHMFQAAVLF